MIYMTLALYFLFFSDSFDRTIISEKYRYNIVPFAEIKRFWNYREQLGTLSLLVNLAGNVICFMPFGFLLPVMTQRRIFHCGIVVVLCTALFSFGIELVQMVSRVGAFDVDDIILNTLGGLLGYIMMRITKHFVKIKILS